MTTTDDGPNLPDPAHGVPGEAEPMPEDDALQADPTDDDPDPDPDDDPEDVDAAEKDDQYAGEPPAPEGHQPPAEDPFGG